MLLATAALLALLIGLAATLTQCNMVTDVLTGTRVAGPEAATNCVAVCAHAYNDSIRVESELHVANVHACTGNPRCLSGEGTRHETAVIRIQLGRQACQNRCHHQGGGIGGR